MCILLSTIVLITIIFYEESILYNRFSKLWNRLVKTLLGMSYNLNYSVKVRVIPHYSIWRAIKILYSNCFNVNTRSRFISLQNASISSILFSSYRLTIILFVSARKYYKNYNLWNKTVLTHSSAISVSYSYAIVLFYAVIDLINYSLKPHY